MASTLRGLVEDESRYLKSFQLFLDSSSEHQCMQDFIRGTLPDILASIGDGKSRINVLGVGSGAGEIDQEMVTQLLLKHPGVMVENEVVEPSRQMLLKYKALVEKASNTENINFIWNEMTASEFEMHWKENKITKQMDFIHMIQMLYYVADPGATVMFFQSLLKKNGKLVIILVSGASGWGRLWRTYKTQLCQTDTCKCVTTSDVKSYLSTKGIKYKNYEIPSKMDITDCFKEGDEGGELLLDFLTEVLNFSKFASPELKRGVLDLLRHPDCSTEEDGRVFFNNNLGVLVLDP